MGRGRKPTKSIDIFKYLDNNSHIGGSKELISSIARTFDISPNTARGYYYRWKEKFMGSTQCVPSNKQKKEIEVKEERTREKLLIGVEEQKKTIEPISRTYKGEYGIYVINDQGVKVSDICFRTLGDLKVYRDKEIAKFNKQINEIEQVFRCGI